MGFLDSAGLVRFKQKLDALFNTKLSTSLKGSANGLAELNDQGKVPATQLPSYVDDVVEYDSFQDLPAVGEAGKIYVTTDTSQTYRWSGSTFTIVGNGVTLGETSSTAYRGDRGKAAYDHASENGKVTTPVTAGLYKVSVTGEGHIGSAEAVTKADIELLGIPGADTWRGIQDNLTSNGNTTDSLSANQGYLLANGLARDNSKRSDEAPEELNWFKGTPKVSSDGGMEVGKYIDFHDADDSNLDYSARITGSNTGFALTGTTKGTFEGDLTGDVTGDLTGNADTATQLKTARSINGTNFDGTSNITTNKWGTTRTITVKDADSTNAGTAVNVDGSGNVILPLPSTIKASLTGTATTATFLAPTAAAGYTTDDSGNFTHKRSTTSDYWHLNKNSGSAVLSVYWENGNVSATGTVTAAGFSGPLTGNVTGNVAGNVTGNLTGNVTGNVSGSSGSCTGNAATATKLQTARSLWGNNFDGTAAISGNITISHGASATMTADSTNPKITFSENGSQPVHLIYTDYDSYRSPAGLKVIGGTSATPAWFEVEGQVYAAGFHGNVTGNCSGTAGGVAWGNVSSKPSYYDAKAIKGITRSGTTFTYTCMDGTTGTFTQQDNNTTYSASNGVSLSGTTFSNSGVRATTINGNYLRVNTNGTNADLTIPYATNADKVDNYHASSFYIHDLVGASTSANQDGLWGSTGSRSYHNVLPDGLSGVYAYGQVISFSTDNNGRFQIYAPHTGSSNQSIYFRTGWGTDKKQWRTILHDGNYTSYAADRTAITNISRSGTTFTATRANGTTFTFTQQDNNTTYTLDGLGGAKKTEAIKNITRSGTTFTATRCDGTTFTFTQQDNDTNTWRGIQNNLTSTSTTDSLSAAQGKALYDKLKTCTLLKRMMTASQTTVPNWGSYMFITIVGDGYDNNLIRTFPTDSFKAGKTLWIWENIEGNNYCFNFKLVSMSGTTATVVSTNWQSSIGSIYIYGSVLK